MSRAACRLATPLPMTSAREVTGTTLSSSGSARATEATAILIWSLALAVAPSLSCMWTQEQCSLMLTIWKR